MPKPEWMLTDEELGGLLHFSDGSPIHTDELKQRVAADVQAKKLVQEIAKHLQYSGVSNATIIDDTWWEQLKQEVGDV